MGRTTSKPVETVDLPALDGDALTNNQNLVSLHRSAVMDQFGDGLNYDRTRLVNEARFIWHRVLKPCWKLVSA